MGSLDAGQRRRNALFGGSGLGSLGGRRNSVCGCVMAAVASVAAVAARPVAADHRRRNAVPAGLFRISAYPRRQPGPRTPRFLEPGMGTLGKGRREADGTRLLYGGNPLHRNAALRPLVQRRLSELLLLGLLHPVHSGAVDRHSPGNGVQPGRSAAVCIDGYRRRVSGLQPGSGGKRPPRRRRHTAIRPQRCGNAPRR